MSDTTTIKDIKETIDLQRFDKEAMKIIRNYTILATGSGLIPNPILGIGATTGIQVMMIKKMCTLFNVPFDRKVVNVVINSTVGSALAKAASVAVAVGMPGVSAPMKGLSGAGIAGLYTATVGEFYKVHFQKGGTLEDASITDIGKYFKAEIENGDISMNSIANPMEMAKRIINPN